MTDLLAERVSRLLAVVSTALQVTPVPYGGQAATLAADYWLWTHRIYVSHELADQLNDYQLACLLAHELGHAHTRGRLVLSMLMGLSLRLGLPFFVLGALLTGGFLAGGIAGGLAFYAFVLGNRYLRLWEEAPADDFGVLFAGDPEEYRAVIKEVVQAVGWRPDKLFHMRMARLAS